MYCAINESRRLQLSGSPGRGYCWLAHLRVEGDGPGHKVDPPHYDDDDVEGKGVHNGHRWLHVVQAMRRNAM